jgi:hypothetical protein
MCGLLIRGTASVVAYTCTDVIPSISPPAALTEVRYSFARSCLRTLKRQSVAAVYHLTSELWNLSQEKLMVLHVGALVEDDSGDGDEEAEYVMSQVRIDRRTNG